MIAEPIDAGNALIGIRLNVNGETRSINSWYNKVVLTFTLSTVVGSILRDGTTVDYVKAKTVHVAIAD